MIVAMFSSEAAEKRTFLVNVNILEPKGNLSSDVGLQIAFLLLYFMADVKCSFEIYLEYGVCSLNLQTHFYI